MWERKSKRRITTTRGVYQWKASGFNLSGTNQRPPSYKRPANPQNYLSNRYGSYRKRTEDIVSHATLSRCTSCTIFNSKKHFVKRTIIKSITITLRGIGNAQIQYTSTLHASTAYFPADSYCLPVPAYVIPSGDSRTSELRNYKPATVEEREDGPHLVPQEESESAQAPTNGVTKSPCPFP